MPWDEGGYSPWIEEDNGEVVCEICCGDGEIDCVLCDRDDLDRGDPCIDCANTGAVRCDYCDGFGTWANVVAAGYAEVDS